MGIEIWYLFEFMLNKGKGEFLVVKILGLYGYWLYKVYENRVYMCRIVYYMGKNGKM